MRGIFNALLICFCFFYYANGQGIDLTDYNCVIHARKEVYREGKKKGSSVLKDLKATSDISNLNGNIHVKSKKLFDELIIENTFCESFGYDSSDDIEIKFAFQHNTSKDDDFIGIRLSCGVEKIQFLANPYRAYVISKGNLQKPMHQVINNFKVAKNIPDTLGNIRLTVRKKGCDYYFFYNESYVDRINYQGEIDFIQAISRSPYDFLFKEFKVEKIFFN